ncbi:hypothetical protein V500_10557 [Pseudogymnoascus sp. VKM F-4518 (FW-2643)]|nr:hypothetical protein V500_10557 [Pseudogymnoascus sp. VKM F-4518 (FW-2643)]
MEACDTQTTLNMPSTPQVQVFQAATVTIDQVVDAIKIAGACILRNAVAIEHIDEIEQVPQHIGKNID